MFVYDSLWNIKKSHKAYIPPPGVKSILFRYLSFHGVTVTIVKTKNFEREKCESSL